MTPQEFQTYLNHQRLQIEATNRIADALERLTVFIQLMADAVAQMSPRPTAPDVVFDLKDWATFDWSTIGAQVIRRDDSGPTVVSWRGQTYFRRSPNNKFTAAIWFSRCIGKDDSGKNVYERLCTFKSLKDIEIDELPDKVVKVATRS